MQKPNDIPQNNLLTHVIRFLHGEESNFENIKTLIDRSSIDNLVLTFSFLIKWLPNHLNDELTEEAYDDSIQSAFEIISHIIQKVPPIILYHKLPENDIESADCSHWLMSELLEPIKKRIINLRSYILPNNTFHFHCIIPQIFYYKEEKENKKSKAENILRIEKNINPNYEAQIFKYLKCLIVNHAPIQFFKPFSYFQHSRLILTNVIIEILDELNQTQNATHEQLLFAFSSLFLYVYALAFENEIDGQLLCEYLRSRVFLSPFCLLGMVKYIISYLYLFNLLTPKEYINDGVEPIDPQASNKSNPYVYVDLTNDKLYTPLIQKIPTILINYFLPRTMKKENQPNNTSDVQDEDNKFFIYMYLSTVEFSIKMRYVFMSAKDKYLGSAHVYSLGVLLLRYIYIYFQRMLLNFVDRDMFTPNFTSFIKTVFSILTTTFSDPLGSKFYDVAINDIRTIRATLNGSYLFLLPIILRNYKVDNIFKFCLKAINDNEISRNGRIIIVKLVQCDYPKVSQEFIDRIKETKDIITLLSYIDFLTNYKMIRNFKEASILEESRQTLLNQLIVGNSYSNNNNNNVTEINANNIADEKPFVFRPFKALSTINRDFNDFSRSIIESYESPTQMQAMNDLLHKVSDEDQPMVIYFFSLTSCIENESFSETITDMIISGLESKDRKPLKANNLSLNPNEYYYVVSQSLLGRLVSFSYTKAAVRLSQAMVHYLTEDLSALHYITNFLAKYRPICPIGVLESFAKVVSNLPCAEEYYELNLNSSSTSSLQMGLTNPSHSIFVNKVFSITEMLKDKKCQIIQNPNVITQEYQSPFQHAMAFAICILGLTTTLQAAEASNLSSSSVAAEINDPSLSLITNSMNSFDFGDNQGSSFYNPLMEFVSTFDSTSNFDATPNLSTGFNQTTNFDSTPKPSSNPNDIVNPAITDEIAEALLSPVTDFNRLWFDRDSCVKICSLIAAHMDNKIAMKYLDLIIKGNNNEFYIQAGVSFLLNANLSVLEYACQSLTNYITDFNTNFSNNGNSNYNAKIDFFFKILIPSVWRIQGENRVGMILMDGILKSVTQQTPQKMFNAVIDIITYVYIKLELYDYRIQIIKSAVNSGYSPEMIMLIESCLPVSS